MKFNIKRNKSMEKRYSILLTRAIAALIRDIVVKQLDVVLQKTETFIIIIHGETFLKYGTNF